MSKLKDQRPATHKGLEPRDETKKKEAGARWRSDGDPIEGQTSQQGQGGDPATQGGGGSLK